MENKKGGTTLLPEEVLKIIIAVVCIILLLILVGKIYSIFIAKTKVEQAKSTLNMIQGKIDYMKAQNINSLSFIINSPRDYFVYGVYANALSKCNGKYCLCFAPSFEVSDHPGEVIQNPIASFYKIDEQNAVCKAFVNYIAVKNKNNDEYTVAIYQSTPVLIEIDQNGNTILTFDTGSTSDFANFLNSWKKRLEKIVIK
jgi:hypothetical protein